MYTWRKTPVGRERSKIEEEKRQLEGKGINKDGEKPQIEEKGINIDGEKVLHLRLAEDVALTTDDAEERENQLNAVDTERLKIGFKSHKGETKFMTNIDTTDNIQIDGTEIEKVNNCKYLGQIIAMKQ